MKRAACLFLLTAGFFLGHWRSSMLNQIARDEEAYKVGTVDSISTQFGAVIPNDRYLLLSTCTVGNAIPSTQEDRIEQSAHRATKRALAAR